MKKNDMEELFRERKFIGQNLLEIIKEKGYTKISFSQEVNISRPTLNHLFEGEINSKTTFEKHIKKISAVLGIETDDLMLKRNMNYVSRYVMYSRNEPEKYIPEVDEKEQFEVLEDLLRLCEFYY